MTVKINTGSDREAALEAEVERLREENARLKDELAAQGPETVRWSKWWPRHGEEGSRRAGDGELCEQRPYMAKVHASRISGGATLFDSEHTHRNFIALRISSAYRNRDLSHDWIHSDKELIEVYMSESQWAHLISSLNYSDGAPATLQHVLHQRVDQPPAPEARTDKFGSELRKRFEKGLAELDAFMEAQGLSKAKRAHLSAVRRELEANGAYVVKCFEEHMEGRRDKAKTEIEAEMRAAMQRVAEAALRNALTEARSGPETGGFFLDGPEDAEVVEGATAPSPGQEPEDGF